MIIHNIKICNHYGTKTRQIFYHHDRFILAVKYFMNFAFLCFVVKINFTKVSPCHTFLRVHVGHSQKYFFAKGIFGAFLQKCFTVIINQYAALSWCVWWVVRHSDSSQIASSVSGTHCLVLLLGFHAIKGISFLLEYMDVLNEIMWWILVCSKWLGTFFGSSMCQSTSAVVVIVVWYNNHEHCHRRCIQQ